MENRSTPRPYALNDEMKGVLAALGKAVLLRRTEKGWDPKQAERDMSELIEQLDSSGANLLQRRPNDARIQIPEVWRDPLTNEPLPSPFSFTGEAAKRKALTILTKHDPALLSHFEQMHADPYGYVQRLREDQARREALSAIEYDEGTHQKSNPFVSGNKTAQSELTKNDKLLADFYQQEALPVKIPLFGKAKNLTVRGRLGKNADTAAIVELAEKVWNTWRVSELADAEAQAAHAQAALRKLEAA